MPKLEEGNFWIRATLPMSISLDQSPKYVRPHARHSAGVPGGQDRRMHRPEPHAPRDRQRVSQLGRPDDGTDVTGFFNIEFFCPLKPFEQWKSGLTKEKLTDQLKPSWPPSSRARSSVSPNTSMTTWKRPSPG